VRIKKNPLRVLDCKNETCREIVNKLNITDAHICPECKTHFAKVKAGLNSLGVKYEITPLLVRGLDYYTGTVFEVTHPELGSQDAIGAGGRYNNLVKELGGAQTGASGFAFGVERLILAAKLGINNKANNLVYLIALGEDAKKLGVILLADLRLNGIPADSDYEGKSLKGALRKANDLSAKFVLIIGENELKSGLVTLKNMASGEQKEIKMVNLVEELK
ncbi:MAG: ATP phosphoribosyltransferase regulatory subunit, partial [Candidatus Omnitrophota bacterium]